MENKELSIVSFSQAKKLQELGFNWKCDYHYSTYNNELYENSNPCIFEYHEPRIPAPNLCLVQKWLRLTYNILVEVRWENYREILGVYSGWVIGGNTITKGKEFKEYEEALSEGIDNALILLDEKYREEVKKEEINTFSQDKLEIFIKIYNNIYNLVEEIFKYVNSNYRSDLYPANGSLWLSDWELLDRGLSIKYQSNCGWDHVDFNLPLIPLNLITERKWKDFIDKHFITNNNNKNHGKVQKETGSD